MSVTPWQTRVMETVFTTFSNSLTISKSATLRLPSLWRLISTLVTAGRFTYRRIVSHASIFLKACFQENVLVNIGTFVNKHWHLLLQPSIFQGQSDARARTSVYTSSHHVDTEQSQVEL